MKNIGLFLLILLVGCATLNNGVSNNIQILQSNSTLINGCKKLGPIHVDIQSINFNTVANEELIRQAHMLGADALVITNRQNLPFGHIIIDGTALSCYK